MQILGFSVPLPLCHKKSMFYLGLPRQCNKIANSPPPSCVTSFMNASYTPIKCYTKTQKEIEIGFVKNEFDLQRFLLL